MADGSQKIHPLLHIHSILTLGIKKCIHYLPNLPRYAPVQGGNLREIYDDLDGDQIRMCSLSKPPETSVKRHDADARWGYTKTGRVSVPAQADTSRVYVSGRRKRREAAVEKGERDKGRTTTLYPGGARL